MPTYLFVHHGGSMPESQEEGQALMDGFIAWNAEVGDQMVDLGSALIQHAVVSPDGTVSRDAPGAPDGYGMITAPNIEAAIEIAKRSPAQTMRGATITVCEALEVPDDIKGP